LLTAFLERGCEPATARLPRRVISVRPLSSGEMAELIHPLTRSLVPVSNLLLLPRPARRPHYEV
jgi:hypothetical protein